MKKTINALKYYAGLKSDKALAELVGVTENTITRAKAGHKTKLHAILPMLVWCFENFSESQHEAFLEMFAKDNH